MSGGAEMNQKPAGSTWTDDQWKAIVSGGRNILVAAAAGSGKTAVLVERIIRKISADTDVDRLLVATFTKAAAAEMKERIRIALEKELARNPESEHLRRQLALMGRASITTLHSFCLDVIRRYYSLIGLDPGFRIANETEAELLRIDVLDALFEERYEAAEAGEPEGMAFASLVDRFGGERGDEPVYGLVMKLYHFAQSNPWPEAWLRETAASFDVEDAAALGASHWVEGLRGVVTLELEGAIAQLEQAMGATRQPGGPSAYAVTFEEDAAIVRGLLSQVTGKPWETWHEAFASAVFGKLKSQRGDDVDKAIQERAKELRENAKTIVGDLKDKLFGRSPDAFAAELRELAPFMRALAELVIAFGARFEAAKRERGLLDFGDMEHYCLRILRDPASTPELTVPSSAALEYRRQFDEILLDEYQDTNMVQEAIVELIALPGAGNRFMVGDVKQSIYRFRLAEPNLFLRKYKAYGVGEDDATRTASAEVANSSAFEVGSGGEQTPESGIRIDLARNFRSRQEVVDGVNVVFRAIMRENVAEMDYDARAELVCGASYPPASDGGPPERYAIEFALLDRGNGASDDAGDDEAEDNGETGVEREGAAEPAEDLQVVQLEARYIAEQILRLRGQGADDGGDSAARPFMPFDGRRGGKRPLAWRDIVILLRADKQWAPVLIEELQQRGIPAYAELGSGYFEATEVETMLSLLRVIDNPYQDIPLAGALRSPLAGLTAEELALIRISAGHGGSFYDAVRIAETGSELPETTRAKLGEFLVHLERWREEARAGALSELLWRIYRESGYYDLVGGMPGGLQRQANLRALYDRARQYEATSFRGLFRFLRFVDRMRENGGDLGTARALGEQEDVVRIMSIHKSKGLEFPVVFVAGLGKSFNKQDLNASFLMHKQLGFGPKFIDTDIRVTYPTLPYLSIREQIRKETLAEEMRILYVALTRPKEKMFLVGTVPDAAKTLERWQSSVADDGGLSDFSLSQAKRFIDWIGPLAMRSGVQVDLYEGDLLGGGEAMIEPAGLTVEEAVLDVLGGAVDDGIAGRADGRSGQPAATGDGAADKADSDMAIGDTAGMGIIRRSGESFASWRSGVVPASVLGFEAAAAAEPDEAAVRAFEERLQAVRNLVPVMEPEVSGEEIERRLNWSYPYRGATVMAAKTSVTEMKRLHADPAADEESVLLPMLEERMVPDLYDRDIVSFEGERGPRISIENEATVGIDAAASQAVQAEWSFGDELESAEDSAALNEEPFAAVADQRDFTFRMRRPKFMEEVSLTAAERGTVHHLVMQHMPLEGMMDEEQVKGVLRSLIERQMLTAKQGEAVDSAAVAAFYREPVGQRLLRAKWVKRETPFSCAFAASRVYPDAAEGAGDEPIMIQGVIDCLFEDEGGLVLLDYKTDRVAEDRYAEAAEKHRFQMKLYAEAIGMILGRPVDACYLFFLNGGRAVQMF
ncbi:UvrD-helicase domain-containing protein [Paenibacillus methanolicus]|uniref:ATP-dependent helicase/nuclease subunit A n=1 Tax=Paenibacillus methanolicus TaxID=582686 RepID=A0A5S5CHP3_9BACL|nr:UvrD-helicase domain-containing protein [Paenibacillus methanolicus]TYP78022.1 ATP-dependent helicase/nuclease subunit A [Paenibacillus methanolicus]